MRKVAEEVQALFAHQRRMNTFQKQPKPRLVINLDPGLSPVP